MILEAITVILAICTLVLGMVTYRQHNSRIALDDKISKEKINSDKQLADNKAESDKQLAELKSELDKVNTNLSFDKQLEIKKKFKAFDKKYDDLIKVSSSLNDFILILGKTFPVTREYKPSIKSYTENINSLQEHSEILYKDSMSAFPSMSSISQEAYLELDRALEDLFQETLALNADEPWSDNIKLCVDKFVDCITIFQIKIKQDRDNLEHNYKETESNNLQDDVKG